MNNERPIRSKTEKKKIFIRLSKYVFAQWYLFVPAVLITLLANQLALLGPKYSGDAIDAISLEAGVNFAVVGNSILKMLLCYLFSSALNYVLEVIMVHLSQRIVHKMRKQLFQKLTRLPVKYFDNHLTGDIISHMSYDIDTVNATLSHDLVQIMKSLYTVIGSLVFMWYISKPMILVFVITVPISLLFTRYRSKKVRPLFTNKSRKLGELNGFAEEMLSGTNSIKLYSAENAICDRFDVRNNAAMTAHYNAEYYGAALGPTVNFINNLSLSLVMIAGGILYMYSASGAVAEGTLFFISLGGIAQFVQYSRKFAGPINEFANVLNEFQSAFSAADRVFTILDEEPEKEDAADALTVSAVKGDVDIKNVFFGYDAQKPILKDVSLKVEAGQTVAIVGPTGAGKTTIINLLMRFYDIDSGAILLDGNDIYNIKRADLRKQFTMVLQDTWLFHGTVKENIAYGKENATDEEIISAAEKARIHSFIEGLPNGYDTHLTDEGVNISKGQRQLLTIARAILSDSPVLILDEATSNVDSRTEIKIQEAMDKLMEGRTCFVIAHRLSTVKNADLILVLQHGKVTEMGTHDSLLKEKGFYATLYNSQFE